MMRIGLLVNPIAGIGGPQAMKGSDQGWRDALDAGATPTAPDRARRFVAAVGSDVSWTSPPGALGAAYIPVDDAADVALVLEDQTFAIGHTRAEDTRRVARELAACDLDLICFLGGDGTATDIAAAIGTEVPCLGVPAGVKITSEVFAHDVEEAAWLVQHLTAGFETTVRDVTDLDEEAYRDGRLDTRLTGSLRVPLSPVIQGGKCATATETPLGPLLDHVLRDWDHEALWLMGAGSVCHAVKSRFWGEPTLLGVDAIHGDRIIATDLDAAAIDALVADHDHPHLLLSPIGGQGVLLGRGTQVLSPATLRRIGWERIHVIAPSEKLIGQRGLWIDSGDADFDAEAPDYLRVVTGWNETRMVRALHGEAGRPR